MSERATVHKANPPPIITLASIRQRASSYQSIATSRIAPMGSDRADGEAVGNIAKAKAGAIDWTAMIGAGNILTS